MNKDSLGDRMKSFEDCYRTKLPIRMPVIIRVDGKAFHTYTKNCKKPVDDKLVEVMNDTAKYLCTNIQGAQLAYIQSDEISVLINNYKTIDTQSWLENNIQKMASISASMASTIFSINSGKIWDPYPGGYDDYGEPRCPEEFIRPAFFDSRVFVLPKEEVTNYFLWRQLDATRNSVQMLARSLYSHKECTDKNNSQLQELCFKKGINWNDCPTPQKRGRCVIKSKLMKTSLNPKTGESITAERSEWVVDNDIPVFSKDRSYIDKFVEYEKL